MHHFFKSINFLTALIVLFLFTHTAETLASQKSATPRLAAVIIKGSTVFEVDQLLESYEHLLGSAVKKNLIKQVRKGLNNEYTNDGYLSPHIDIQQHTSHPEILIAKITEARIGRLNLTPFRGSTANKVRNILSQAEFSYPLHNKDLTSISNVISKIKGAEKKVAFVRNKSLPGIYDLVVNIVPHVSTYIEVSNEGSKVIDKERIYASVNIHRPSNQPLRFGIHVNRSLLSDSYQNIGLSTSWLLKNNSQLSLYYDNADIDFESSGNVFTELERQQWLLEYSKLFILSSQSSSGVSLNLSKRDFERTQVNDFQIKEDLRTTSLSGFYYSRNQRIEFITQASIRKGLNEFGAERVVETFNNNVATINTTDIDFLLAYIQSSIWFTLPLNITTKMTIGGQYSNHQLPGSQTFALGGKQFTKAYEPGEFSGDRGIAGQLTFSKLLNADKAISYSPYIYYGIGHVSNATGLHNGRSAASAGLGIKLLTNQFNAYIEADKPLTRPSSYENDAIRVSASLSWQF